MRRMLLSLALAASLSGIAFSEEALDRASPTAFERFPLSLGYGVDSLGDFGLEYSRWSGDFGFSAMGDIVLMNQLDQMDFSHYSLALQGLYRIFARDYCGWFSSQVFLFAAANLTKGGLVYVPVSSVFPLVSTFAGYGFEFLLAEHFGLLLETGVSASLGIFPFELAGSGFTAKAAFTYRFADR